MRISGHVIRTSAAQNANLSVLNCNGDSFAVSLRNLNFGPPLFFWQRRAMASAKKDKEAAAAISTNPISAVENGSSSRLVELSAFKDDASKLESMSVEQLRATLRTFGASTRGRKHELVSTLKHILESKVEGNCSLIVDETPVKVSSQPEATSINESLQSTVDVSGASVLQRSKRKKQKLVDKDMTINASSVTATGKDISIQTSGVSGLKRPKKGKLIAESASKYVEVSGVQESAYENEPWTRFAHKKPQKGWIPYNPRTMRPPPPSCGTKCAKILSWNVNGLRALRRFDGFSATEFVQREGFDVLCLQETKLQEKDVESFNDLLEGYENSFWTCSSSKLGYSGTAIISRSKPLSVYYGLGKSDHDSEGRLVTAEFDSYYLICVYVPNSGDGLKRLSYRVNEWDPCLSDYMKELEKTKPVILTGDLNCAHQEIDIYNPAGNRRSAGFTDEERQSFEANFLSQGFVDTFRKLHPGAIGYTYWGYRHGGRKTNKGWRLDYFIVSESIAEQVHDSYILPDVTGSDHCPIGLILKLKQ
ncbi:hypothetical protein Dimus_029735 [Dionaea muscipula]